MVVEARSAAISGLPSGWKSVTFGEIAQSVTDRVDNPAEAGVDRYVGLEHLDPDTLHLHRWGHPSEVEATKLRFRPGDVIFGRRRAYQRKLAVADFEGICSAHALVLRARPEVVEPDYLPVFMQSEIFFRRALEISVGSLSPTINWKTLAVQRFPLPPRDEQRRIADILWAADAAVERWREVEFSVDQSRDATIHALIQASGFQRQRLEVALTGIVAGRSVVGVDEPAQESQYGVLKVSAVGPYGFAADENKRLIHPSDFDPRYAISAGDLLITRANTRELVGRAARVQADYPNLMLCDKTLRLDVNPVRCRPNYLLHVLQTTEVRKQIESVATGTANGMKNLSQEKLRSLLVPLPSVEDQNAFCLVMDAFSLAWNDAQSAGRNARRLARQLSSSLLELGPSNHV